jgi:LmbE family N-acetylglucosaminyl deacetylase
MIMSGNSFFEESYTGIRAAVFVPHQDDETNVAAALIASLSSQGAEVFVI